MCTFSRTIIQVFFILKHVDRHGWGFLRFVFDDNNVCIHTCIYIHINRKGWVLVQFLIDANNVCVYVFMYIKTDMCARLCVL